MILRLFTMMGCIDLGARSPFEATTQRFRRFLDMGCEISIFKPQEDHVVFGDTELGAGRASLPLSYGPQFALFNPLRVGGGSIGQKADLHARALGHLSSDGATTTEDFVVRMGGDDPRVGPQLFVADLLGMGGMPALEHGPRSAAEAFRSHE
jgi:hypothetical protein